MRVPRALTIATSDSGGGAGVQADLKAFAAAGAHGSSVLVALTAQNTVGVTAIHELPPEFVRAQLDAIFDDIGVDAAKPGMLCAGTLTETAAHYFRGRRAPLVVDRVMGAAWGARLLEAAAAAPLAADFSPPPRVAPPTRRGARALPGSAGPGRELAARLH